MLGLPEPIAFAQSVIGLVGHWPQTRVDARSHMGRWASQGPFHPSDGPRPRGRHRAMRNSHGIPPTIVVLSTGRLPVPCLRNVRFFVVANTETALRSRAFPDSHHLGQRPAFSSARQ